MHAHIAEGRRIFDTIVGSQAYGTSRPDSDEDTVAVCVPLEEYFFSSKTFEQVNYSETDRVIYCVRKMIRLMADNNPNCLDILFTPERCIKKTTKYWDLIRENSSRFVSKKCKFTFSGYAVAQLARIRTHRSFLLDPPKQAPERSMYGLPESSIFPTSQIDAIVLFADDFFLPEKKNYITEALQAIQTDMILPLLRENVIEEYRPIAMEFFRLGIKSQMDAIKSIGSEFIKEEFKDAAVNELRYASAMKNWKRYLSWKASRNKKRAELEEKFKFDTKHASHLVRLMRMGVEILNTGKVNVDRTNIDAEELKAIRDGAWSYDQIEEYSQQMDKQLDELYKISTLPKNPDREFIDSLCMKVVRNYLEENR